VPAAINRPSSEGKQRNCQWLGDRRAATADRYQVPVTGYAPFLMVSDPTGIVSVVVLHDCGQWSGPTFGFFDVYTDVPEPATMSLLALGALSLIRRRK
jgi:hypothetical protein